MVIFSPRDVERITTVHKRRVAEDRELFFSYFEDEALRYYEQYFKDNKELILSQVESELRRVSPNMPVQIRIARFFTFKEKSAEFRALRRAYQDEQILIGDTPKCYFHSLSGIHITDLRAIFHNSRFRQRLLESIGIPNSGLCIKSQLLCDYTGVAEYENVLYLTYIPKYT